MRIDQRKEKDLRQFPRFPAPGSKPIKADLGPAGTGVLLDISTGGIRVQSLAPLRRGVELPVRIDLPNFSQLLTGTGTVVWSKSSALAGIRFASLTISQQKDLELWLNEVAANPSGPGKEEKSFFGILMELHEKNLGYPEALRYIAKRVLELTPATGAAISLGSREDTVRMVSVGQSPQPGVRISAKDGILGECSRQRKLIYIQNAESDPRIARSKNGFKFGSAVVVPLAIHGDIRGFLEAFSNAPYAFNAKAIEILERLADATVVVEQEFTPQLVKTEGVLSPLANATVAKLTAAPVEPMPSPAQKAAPDVVESAAPVESSDPLDLPGLGVKPEQIDALVESLKKISPSEEGEVENVQLQEISDLINTFIAETEAEREKQAPATDVVLSDDWESAVIVEAEKPEDPADTVPEPIEVTESLENLSDFDAVIAAAESEKEAASAPLPEAPRLEPQIEAAPPAYKVEEPVAARIAAESAVPATAKSDANSSAPIILSASMFPASAPAKPVVAQIQITAPLIPVSVDSTKPKEPPKQVESPKPIAVVPPVTPEPPKPAVIAPTLPVEPIKVMKAAPPASITPTKPAPALPITPSKPAPVEEIHRHSKKKSKQVQATAAPVPLVPPAAVAPLEKPAAFEPPMFGSANEAPDRPKTPLLVGAAAALILVAGGGFYMWTSRTTTTKPGSTAVYSQTPAQTTPAPASTPAMATTAATPAKPEPVRTDESKVPSVERKATHASPLILAASEPKHAGERPNVEDAPAPSLTQIASSGTPNVANIIPSTAPIAKPTMQARNVVAGGNVIKRVSPVYPPAARQMQIDGVITLLVHVKKDGTVASVHRTAGPAIFTNSAVEALKQWRFEPTTVDGKPQEFDTSVTLRFTR